MVDAEAYGAYGPDDFDTQSSKSRPVEWKEVFSPRNGFVSYVYKLMSEFEV